MSESNQNVFQRSLDAFRWSTLSNYVFVLPAVLLFLVFNLYPFIEMCRMSLLDWNGIDLNGGRFVGLANFKDILFDNTAWWLSMKNAATITLLALILQNSLALVLAWIVDREIRGGQVYRSIFFLPPILSGVVVGLIWNWIFQGDFGLLNSLLEKMGHPEWTRAWFADTKTALPALAVVHMWKGFGWGFIILLAGLQGISRDLYEAARVDGASEWQIFRKITIPQMIPVFVLVSVLTILGTMQIYDLVITTTRGGPAGHTEVPMTRIINAISPESRLGYACAMGMVFGFVLLLLSLVQIQLSKRFKAD